MDAVRWDDVLDGWMLDKSTISAPQEAISPCSAAF